MLLQRRMRKIYWNCCRMPRVADIPNLSTSKTNNRSLNSFTIPVTQGRRGVLSVSVSSRLNDLIFIGEYVRRLSRVPVQNLPRPAPKSCHPCSVVTQAQQPRKTKNNSKLYRLIDSARDAGLSYLLLHIHTNSTSELL